MALACAAKELRSDPEVVLTAVRSHGLALHHVALDLRRSRDIVLAAVASHGLALQYAAEELCRDRSVVLAAVKAHPVALIYASQELQMDPEVLTLCAEAVPRSQSPKTKPSRSRPQSRSRSPPSPPSPPRSRSPPSPPRSRSPSPSEAMLRGGLGSTVPPSRQPEIQRPAAATQRARSPVARSPPRFTALVKHAAGVDFSRRRRPLSRPGSSPDLRQGGGTRTTAAAPVSASPLSQVLSKRGRLWMSSGQSLKSRGLCEIDLLSLGVP